MKVILLQNIKNLGQQYDIKDVAAGYARNFLFPRNLAKLATKKAIAEVLALKQKKMEEEKKAIAQAKEEAKIIEQQIYSIRASATPEGKLFGSITKKEIAKTISEATSKTIEEKNILLNEPIRKVGEYKVDIRIYKDVVAQVKVRINS